MATEICLGPMVDPKWTQDGKSLMMFYQSKIYEAVAVKTITIQVYVNCVVCQLCNNLAVTGVT